ncbi:MAG: hypothetical protein HWE26_19380 [Alteromonadaceae bacterium]|nr:hypothetical protein [Alteromonadaceae bacterium]
MSNQATNNEQLVVELTDTINGLKAACMHLLSAQHSSAQATIMMDKFLIENSAEAIRKREQEVEAKRNNEAMRNARADFLDRVKADYWSMCYMSQKQRDDHIKSIWDELKAAYGMPKLTAVPAYNHHAPTFREMLSHMEELQAVIDSVNLTFADEHVKHSEKSITEYRNVMEAHTSKHINEIKTRTDINEQDKQRFIEEAKADCQYKIKQHESTMNRQIASAKASFVRVESAKAELKKLSSLITKSN